MLNTHKSEAAQQKTQHHGNTVLVRSLPKQSLPQPHRSFLLRCWQGFDAQGRVVWRYSILAVSEEPKEHALQSLGQLVDFLLSELTVSNNEGK